MTMATQPMFDDLSSKYEYLAREQLELGDDWYLESMSSAIQVGIVEQIERLDADDDLDDGSRWRELEVNDAPLAWLPKGLMLITMKHSDGELKNKATFIHTQWAGE
jgi:hypothetical protein